jgi:hypothetical protein
MAKTIGSQDVARKKNKMPAFLAKAKKNPKSTNPGKNTKGRSKSAPASGGDLSGDAPGGPQPSNRADYAMAELRKPKPSRDKRMA